MVLGILAKPGGNTSPALTDSGRAAMALLGVAIVLAVRHIAALLPAARLQSVDDKP